MTNKQLGKPLTVRELMALLDKMPPEAGVLLRLMVRLSGEYERAVEELRLVAFDSVLAGVVLSDGYE